AHFAHQGDKPLPGTAAVAMQMGSYLAKAVKAKLTSKAVSAFSYKDKGSMAVIGRNEAVADLNFMKMSGFPAWFIWIFVHIYFLIEFDNKLLVLLQWGWNYFTYQRGARLITGDDSIPALSEAVMNEIETELVTVADSKKEAIKA
ncbi:MAG: NAD(P)/FAD-dependent oxidoreductase, partial [Moorea sp. SIO3C2]|nr:NAD(P)/FAD-dependent oxidoreductase [Moorena sp. SIO3C2]